MSFEFRAKDSLGVGIADMRKYEISDGGPVTVTERWLKTRCVPGATYLPAERREERPLRELQGVAIEDK